MTICVLDIYIIYIQIKLSHNWTQQNDQLQTFFAKNHYMHLTIYTHKKNASVDPDFVK